MSKKLLITIATAGGAGIGIPLYIVNSNNSSRDVAQNSQLTVSLADHSRSGDTPLERKSLARGKCEFIRLLDEIDRFLSSRHRDRSNHVTVSCSNTVLKTDYVKLPDKWIGWFPTSMFVDQSKTILGQEVEINTSTKQEEGDQGSYTEITFEGAGLRASFSGRIDPLTQKELSREVSLAKVSENDKGELWVYLFSDPQANKVAGDS